MSSSIPMLLDYIEKVIAELDAGIRKKSLRKTRTEVEKLTVFSNCLKAELPKEFVETTFADFDRHFHFIKYYLKKRDFEWVRSNFDDIKKKDLPKIKSEISEHVEKQKAPEIRIPVRPKVPKKEIPPLSNKVFIVHGRNHEPMKELKTMLYDFGLNPIVLHEKATGGLTLAEKLERYSKDVGYAFVILTPDDVGAFRSKFVDVHPQVLSKRSLKAIRDLKLRARQNVIFEMGYFWGLLKRQKVCCLLKGDVEKPSDIEGILYVPFKDSVEEVRFKIFKELTEAGYEIKL